MTTEIKNFYAVNTFRKEILHNELSYGQVYKLIKQGEIPSIKVGQRIFIPGGYVAELLEKAKNL